MDDEAAAWPLSLRLVHWASAALVLAALALGVYMVQLVHDLATRFGLTQAHKSIGVSVLALTIVRLCLRLVARAPKPAPAAPLILLAAKSAHIALYALLLAMPLSGWLMATTTPVRVPTVVFGLFVLPYPFGPDLPTYRAAHAAHVVSAIALASLIVLHIGAALTHTLIRRDRTFTRMWLSRAAPRSPCAE
jgi:cytochrome b561